MTDINAAAIVSYIKHWDNDTKGTMEFPNVDLAEASRQAQTILLDEALEDSEDDSIINRDPATLFTITKVAYGVPSNWLGV